MAILKFFRSSALIHGRDFTVSEAEEQLKDYLICEFYSVRFRDDSCNDGIIYYNVHREFLPYFITHSHPDCPYIFLHPTIKGDFKK